MTKQRYYKYVITLDEPLWPRKIADALMYRCDLAPYLLSVTDLQNDTHIYGDTYVIDGRYVRPRKHRNPHR